MRRRYAWVMAGVAAATIAASAEEARPRPFMAAVLRQDGGLIPIGTYTGRRWQKSWPNAPLTELEIPLTTGAIPREWWGKPGPRIEWETWIDGSRGGTVRVTAPALLGIQCQTRIALMTDYAAPQGSPPQKVQPYPKVGLAVSPPVAIERIDVLRPGDSDWRTIGPTLKQAFDQAEDLLANDWVRQGDPHPIDEKERHAATPHLEAMYESGEAAHRVYYVEGARVYDHSADKRAICAVAFGGAYFQREGDRVRPMGVDIRVVPCDRRGIVYMLPLGAMTIAGKTYWFAQFSSWDREEYDVIEFKRPRVEAVAGTFGGGC